MRGDETRLDTIREEDTSREEDKVTKEEKRRGEKRNDQITLGISI